MITYRIIETDGTPAITLLDRDGREFYRAGLSVVRWWVSHLPRNPVANVLAVALDEMKEKGLVPHE